MIFLTAGNVARFRQFERVKNIFLTRSQTKTASLGFRLKRLSPCRAHNLCAKGAQIPHLQGVAYFLRRTRRRRK